MFSITMEIPQEYTSDKASKLTLLTLEAQGIATGPKMPKEFSSEPTNKKKYDLTVEKLCGRWTVDCRYNKLYDGTPIRETHYWTKYVFFWIGTNILRFKAFSQSFNRWIPRSALQDHKLIEDLDRKYPPETSPKCFKVFDEKSQFIVSFDNANDCESEEDDGEEEMQYGFEPRKRRKPIGEY